MRIAFLIFMARSGSTLLARHLDGVSADLLVTPEWNVPVSAVRLGDARLRALDADASLDLLRLDRQIANLELGDESLARIARECAGGGARELIVALARANAAKRGREPRAIVIKNSSALFVAEELIEIFPEAVFVHVERDGRAVVNSLIHTESSYDPGHPMGRGDPVHCAQLWSRYLATADALARRHPERVLPVHYEAFLAAPEATVERLRVGLSTRLGVELRPGAGAGPFAVPARERGLHALVEQAPQVARAEGWQRELSRHEGIAVESIERAQLAARGYAPYFLADATPSEVTRARVREYARHVARTLTHAGRRAAGLGGLAFTDRARAGAALRDALFDRFAGRR
jgi:hypothetical protein